MTFHYRTTGYYTKLNITVIICYVIFRFLSVFGMKVCIYGQSYTNLSHQERVYKKRFLVRLALRSMQAYIIKHIIKHCSFDKACQFSTLKEISFKIYLEKQTTGDKYLYKQVQLFHTSIYVCLQSNMLRRKNINYVIFRKFKHFPLYKSVEVHTSANAYGIVNGANQKKIKSSSKEYVT